MIVAANIICIYIMVNNITGQIYIGQTVDFDRRMDEHFKGRNADSQRIDRACLKYGREAFTCKPLEIFDEYDKDVLDDAEEFYIAAYNTFKDKNHYNLTPGGDGAGAGEDNPSYRGDLDDDILADEYLNNKLSCREIARKYNTDLDTVRRR
jgi:group I intron endonuclease